MKFSPKQTAFGRHETFALRYGWLSKGFHHLSRSASSLDKDDATVKLGVGKNMVLSIKYWLKACQLVDVSNQPTELGRLIFDEDDGLDPYLEDEATIWLIHWLIATNPSQATSWFWFFNKYHKPVFTSLELTTALGDWVRDVMVDGKRPSAGTLKNDAQLIHRMYCQSVISNRMPLEEVLDSPLSLLRLVSQAGGKEFQSRLAARPGLPIRIFGFAVLSLMKERKIKTIPLDDLMYSRAEFPAPGPVFRLTENDLITKLEQLVMKYPKALEIRETAGIHQLYLLQSTAPEKLLQDHYEKSQEGVVV
ncbi:DUF4007 family protein [Alloalcanivorax xenomutans]|uniref:DUF4007 family protein n=1 Tax=Alloalcanivorax xenomutans TaxID=1094342 RepID=UPI0024E201AC|nr:DUF4007 family protein [Alloalcanivorax xenomutans]